MRLLIFFYYTIKVKKCLSEFVDENNFILKVIFNYIKSIFYALKEIEKSGKTQDFGYI